MSLAWWNSELLSVVSHERRDYEKRADQPELHGSFRAWLHDILSLMVKDNSISVFYCNRSEKDQCEKKLGMRN